MEDSTIIAVQNVITKMHSQLVKMRNFSKEIQGKEDIFELLGDDYVDYVLQIKEDAGILEEDVTVFQGHFNDFCKVFDEKNKVKIEALQKKQARKKQLTTGRRRIR